MKEKGYSDNFFYKFLVPISSAVWSTPPDLMLKFPAVTLVRFFKNHGFMGLKGHYQWRTVVEGSQRYREKILMPFKDKILLNNPVKEIRRQSSQVFVIDSRGEKREYDKIILASHADESLKILGDPTQQERDLLSKFTYQKNRATLHTDESMMPKEKRAWSSWNYRIGEKQPSTIYWMNNLQQVSEKKDYFVSINDSGEVDPSKVLWDSEYTHPIYNVDSIQAQKKLSELNKNGFVFFCGSYFKYGFHEDALISGIEVARVITGKSIWN